MSASLSPLAPPGFPVLPSVKGVRAGTSAAGIRKAERDDLFIAAFSPGTTVAGTLTSTLCPAASIDWCRSILDGGNGTADALICNSGNANAFTGKAGAASTELMAESVASRIGSTASRVLVTSTGVIGEPMPDEKLAAAVPRLADHLQPTDAHSWEKAANAIRTTDTFAKGSSVPVAGTGSSIVGIAKGSGMIAPNMATMLSFYFTDLGVDTTLLQESLSRSVDQSFNRITVDSDTSTNDAVLIFATGQSGEPVIETSSDPRLAMFQRALDNVTLDLAKQIVRDGEGATKLISVTVTGAVTTESATAIARSIAESPLVKTAMAAEDANWGRIVMAVGKAGQPADRDRLSIWIGPQMVASGGSVFPGYSEEVASSHLKMDEIEIRVDVGVGEHQSTVWTCDLTHGYIEINAGYRT